MKELLEALTKSLVDNPEAVEVTADEKNENGVTVLHLKVAENDIGRVIGKQGKIAKAIRTVMRSAANRQNEKVQVEIN